MGFETVVRPATVPNIRPTARQSVAPQNDDPEKGIAIIRGQPAQTVTTGFSWSTSWSSSNQTERRRQFDVARVYQKDENGTVNKDNFVDIEVINKAWMKGPSGTQEWKFKRMEEADNIEIKERDRVDTSGAGTPGVGSGT